MTVPRFGSALGALGIGVATCLGAADAAAYRPFDGTDADVAGVGEFEAEIGPVQLFSRGTSGYLIAPATTLNLGYAPRWELVADFQNVLGPASGPSDTRQQLVDTDLLTKVLVIPGSLHEEGAGPALAIEFGPLLPNVNAENGFGASVNTVLSQRWPAVALHANSWLRLVRGTLDLEWFEGIIIEGNLDARVRPVSEWFVEHEFVAGTTTISGLIGGIWHAREGLDLDMGLREASIEGQRATEVRLGFTWTLEMWSRR
jgi:hypothetical protein